MIISLSTRLGNKDRKGGGREADPRREGYDRARQQDSIRQIHQGL